MEPVRRWSSFPPAFPPLHAAVTGPFLLRRLHKDAIIAILGAIAKQERARISERVRAGLDRAKQYGTRSGNPIGRPKAIFRRDEARDLRKQGWSWSKIARRLGVGVTTVRRACEEDQKDVEGDE